MGLAALAALAAVTAVPGAAARSTTYDEGVSAAMAGASWSSFAATVRSAEPNMSLYYLLLRPSSVALEGPGDLRALSVAAFVLAVPLVAVLGTQVGDRWAGGLAAVLLATNPFAVTTAQTARSYSLLLLLSVVTTSLVLLAAGSRHGPRPVWLLAWGLLSGLTAYVHLLSVVGTVVQVLAVAVAWPRAARGLLPGLAVATAVWLPLVVLALGHGTATISWLPTPTPRYLGDVVTEVVGGPGPSAVVLAAVLWLLLTRAREPAARFVLVLTAAPPVLLYLFSVVGPTPLLLPRYVVAVTPAAALLVGFAVAGSSRGRSSLVGPVVATAVAALVASATLAGLDRHVTEDDYRAAAQVLSDGSAAEDALVFVDPTAVAAVSVHWPVAAQRAVFPVVPPGGSVYDGRAGLRDIGEEMPRALDAAQQHPRVWLVQSHLSTHWAVDMHDELVAGLATARYRPTWSCRLPGVRVEVWTGPAAPPVKDTGPWWEACPTAALPHGTVAEDHGPAHDGGAGWPTRSTTSSSRAVDGSPAGRRRPPTGLLRPVGRCG